MSSDNFVHYEYWETEPINPDLIYKLRDDKRKAELKYEELSGLIKDPEKTLIEEVNDLQSKLFFAECDMMFYEGLVKGNFVYQHISNDITKNHLNQNGDSTCQEIIHSIKINETYKKAVEEYRNKKQTEFFTNEADDYIDDYTFMATIILYADDDELTNLYNSYLDAYNAYIERMIGIDAIVNNGNYDEYREKKENKEIQNQLMESYNNYKTAKTEYEIFKPLYREKKFEYDKKYANKHGQAVEALQEKNKLTNAWNDIKLKWQTYDEVANDKMKEMDFEDLYRILCTGFVQKISSKVENHENRTKKIIKNIHQMVSLFGLNTIELSGYFEGGIEKRQVIDVEQILEFNFKQISSNLDKIRSLPHISISWEKLINKPPTETTDEETQSIFSSEIILAIIGAVIFLLLLFLIGFAIVRKRNMKRRKKIKGGKVMSYLQDSTLINHTNKIDFNIN